MNDLLTGGDVDAVVVTSRTDLLEETAYFLNLVVKSAKPVGLVSAQCTATAISADGPLDLLDVVLVAAGKNASGKGVLVVMKDEINAARDVTKDNTVNVAAFRALELGYVADGKPYFYRAPTRRHTNPFEFSVSGLSTLPNVEIFFGHAGDNRVLVDAAVAAGANGLIYAGLGNRSVTAPAEAGLVDA